MKKTYLQELAAKVKTLRAEWFTSGEKGCEARQDRSRGDIIRKLVRGKNNKALVAALALELEKAESGMGHQFVGWLSGHEEHAKERKGT